jgi:class 3 adenylate cyclase/tetratricopeptide (TPR) repeat protein
MSNLLRTAAAYVPLSLTRAALDGLLSRPPTEPHIERFSAAVLFADVSGFTPLTEALGQKGSEGPEELTRLLNRYFSWMIAFVEAQGGEIVKFGGDALTVVFPAKEEPLGVAARRARQAAEAMQSSMEEFGIMESSVGLVTLKMKIGIGAGEILSAWVGGVDNRWEYFIAGDPLRQTAQADRKAQQGEIVLSPEAEAVIVPDDLPPRPLYRLDWETVQNLSKVEAILRCFIPRPVRTWLDQELHGWLATLRPMSVLFVNVKKIDYEQPDAIERLHTFVRGVQYSLNHYQGALTRLTVDDKGTVLLILFGAPPSSHEDDPERALRCALDLQALAERQGLQLAIGVTTGRVFAGPVGGDTRREYTVMGDTVNLAARLMIAVGPGHICCSYETYRSAYGQMKFEHLPPVEVKGKIGLIPIYRPIGVYHPNEQLEQLEQVELSEPLFGRQVELAKLIAAINEVQAGGSRIIIIEGEAGIGKSRLMKSSLQLMQERGLTTLLGMGRSIEQETPYRAWRDIFYSYFGLQKIASTPDRRDRLREHVEVQAARVPPKLAQYVPLLNDLFNLDFLEDEATVSLDLSLRQEKLGSLLLALLKIRALEKPLILILEDGHWLDPLSWKLAVQVAVAAVQEQWPLLLMLVTRPLEGVRMRTEATMLAALEETEYLRLDSLTPDETLSLAAMRLGLTRNELPEAVADLVRRRAGGNPFFAEEIFYTLHDNGFITFKTMQDKIRCLISGDLGPAAQTLPATIQNVVLARLDQLPPEKQLMLKVAAVIGQMFAYETLRDTLSKHLVINEGLLRVYLSDLTHLGLIQLETSKSNLTYSFKHAITREVTYQSLLFDRRRQLHRDVAQWYEQTYRVKTGELVIPFDQEVNQNFAVAPTSPPASTPLSPYYTLLVYHWHQAGDEEREGYYASLVGQQAVAQFANAEAIGYISRALALTSPANATKRYTLLLARESVYNRLGEREKQAQDLETLADLVDQLNDPQRKATVALRQADYALATGNYSRALEVVQEAVNQAGQVRNVAIESKGYIIWGKALAYQSNYEAAYEVAERALKLARTKNNQVSEAESLQLLADICRLRGAYRKAATFYQQALAICRANGYRLIEAKCLNTLGQIHYHQGNYSVAQSCFEEAIPIFYTIGHRREELIPFHNIGLVQLRLGHYETARDYFEQSLDIGRELADREVMATALSNLGITYCKLGDYMPGRSYLGQALGIFKEIGNRSGEADALNRFGFIYYKLGDNRTARRYCEAALSIHQEIGNRAGEIDSLTYLGHALTNLGQLEAAEEIYIQALRLHREMSQAGAAIDILAGLAHVAISQNKLGQALDYITEVLTWLEKHGTTGSEDPFWVYLKCHHGLIAAAHVMPDAAERARFILSIAYNKLNEQARRLSHDKVKSNFLKNIQCHAEIVALWEGQETVSYHLDQPKEAEYSDTIITYGTGTNSSNH